MTEIADLSKQGGEHSNTSISMRPPEKVMRLDRLGAFHLSRLSFTRALVRRARDGHWAVERPLWQIDPKGFGEAVYTVQVGDRPFSLICFSQDIPDEERIERVIATAWDTCFVLYDGIPDASEMARLKATVPHQEACRYTEREFILARANRSDRTFRSVMLSLADGRQPDVAELEAVGYLLRTSAVYGNGKFGIADFEVVSACLGFDSGFVAELLTVWLIRLFSVDLVEHCARGIAPERAVPLDRSIRRLVGIGNSTGLGMAPFVVRHPVLIHHWIAARETALARVRLLAGWDARTRNLLLELLSEDQRRLAAWMTSDPVQAGKRLSLLAGIEAMLAWMKAMPLDTGSPYDLLVRRAEDELDIEAQEFLVSLILETHGSVVDDLVRTMSDREAMFHGLDPAIRCQELASILADNYSWARQYDFGTPEAVSRFWYTSQQKLEPRVGWRGEDEGEELELPLGSARDVETLRAVLSGYPGEAAVVDVARDHPDLRHIIRRVLAMRNCPYGEIRENLLDASLRPIDLMRCKLSFLGAEFFDPRSDLLLRVRLFQGAPFPDELNGPSDGSYDRWLA